MSIAQFEEISLTLCIGGLILYMFYILYKLGQESKAGKFGMFVIFIALGLGMFGFGIKWIIKAFMDV